MLLAAAAALSLSGCAAGLLGTVTSVAAPIIASQGQVVLKGTQGLILAELAYNSAASVANETAKACLANPNLPCPITPNVAREMRELNQEAIQALNAGKATSDEVSKAQSAAKVFSIADKIRALVGR